MRLSTPLSRRPLLAAAAAVAVAASGFAFLPLPSAQADPHEAEGTVGGAVAVLLPTKGNNAKGMIHFTPVDGGLSVTGTIRGLDPGGDHGFHVHEFGDVSENNGTGTGGHFNPGGHDHALPGEDTPRHAGDMGNVTADDEGVAEVNVTIMGITLEPGPACILGRGLIVHADRDDGGQPTGNAGARIAQAVIGVAGPKKNNAK